MRLALRVIDVDPARPAALGELVTQATLADAGIGHDADDAPATFVGVGQRLLECLHLARTADESREPTLPREVEAGTRRADAAQLEDLDGLTRALDLELAEVGEVQIAVREALGGFGHEHAARLRQRLHPLREPDCVTDSRVVATALGPDLARNDLSRVDADPGREAEAERAPQLGGVVTCQLAHPKRRVAGPLGMVLLRHRGSEHGHDAVAGELVDRAAELLYALAEQIEEALHDRPPLLRVDLFGQIHRSLYVGEHDRHLFALASSARRRRATGRAACAGRDRLSGPRWRSGRRLPRARVVLRTDCKTAARPGSHARRMGT